MFEIKCPHCGNDNHEYLESNGARGYDREYLCTAPCAPENNAYDGEEPFDYCAAIFNPMDNDERD